MKSVLEYLKLAFQRVKIVVVNRLLLMNFVSLRKTQNLSKRLNLVNLAYFNSLF